MAPHYLCQYASATDPGLQLAAPYADFDTEAEAEAFAATQIRAVVFGIGGTS